MQFSRRHLLTGTGVLLGMLGFGTPAFAEEAFVAVTAIVEHPALDACRDGVRDELKAAGFEEGKNLKFTYESAQGNHPGTGRADRPEAGRREPERDRADLDAVGAGRDLRDLRHSGRVHRR